MPINPEFPQQPQLTPPHHVHLSMKVVMLIFALILVGTLGFFIYDNQKAADDTDYSAPKVTATETNAEETNSTTEETKTYVDEKNGFSFKYPASFYARSDTAAASEDNTLTDLMVSVNKISTTQEADGACGSASKALLQAQKNAFESAKAGASFDTAFKTTNAGVKMSEIITAAGGAKFARGFDLCHGIVEDNDPVQYQFIARTFSGDLAVTLSATLPLADSGKVTPKTEEAQIALLEAGTNTSAAQAIYTNFKDLLDSFTFEK